MGPYEVLEPLGTGGMGEVYRARDGRLGRIVAIKVLRHDLATDRDCIERFEREARSASAPNHSIVLQKCHTRRMKTTIDIPENELKDAQRFAKAKTKRQAVLTALEEYNRRHRMAELVKYSGTFSDRFPTNDEIEAVDASRDRKLHGRSRR